MSIKSSVLALYDAQLDEASGELKTLEKRQEFLKGHIERLKEVRKLTADTLKAEDDNAEGARKPRVAIASKKGSAGLPKTPKEFWLSLITDQKQGTSAILKAAMAKLEIPESDEEKAIALKQRQTASLKTLHDEGAITSEGEQQKRVYFLPKKA